MFFFQNSLSFSMKDVSLFGAVMINLCYRVLIITAQNKLYLFTINLPFCNN